MGQDTYGLAWVINLYAGLSIFVDYGMRGIYFANIIIGISNVHSIYKV